jgi:hypothetical protein
MGIACVRCLPPPLRPRHAHTLQVRSPLEVNQPTPALSSEWTNLRDQPVLTELSQPVEV